MIVTLRPVLETDQHLLFEWYAGTRQAELAHVPWTDAQKQAFLQMQFAAQAESYRTRRPNAVQQIICVDGVPVGRLYLDRLPQRLHIVDITVTAASRNAGIGSQVLHGILADADRTGKAVGIYVESFNPSRRLFERLGFRTVSGIFLKKYPKRSFLGFSMMVTQSFLYNAIFFTYSLVLQNFYHISASGVSVYFFPFAVGNLLGPLILGPFFDTVGRRKMILGTYGFAGLVLAVSAALFQAGSLNATTHTIFWCVSFFFASAGASSAYLTVSEIFPLELRGQAISYFFAISQAAGAIAPFVFGSLIGDGVERGPLTIGYYFGAAIMIIGGAIAWFCGVNAEGQSLEDVAEPLSKAPAAEAR